MLIKIKVSLKMSKTTKIISTTKDFAIFCSKKFFSMQEITEQQDSTKIKRTIGSLEEKIFPACAA